MTATVDVRHTAPLPTSVAGIIRYEATLRAVLCVASLAVMLALFLANRTLPRYVDEADNLLGGQMVARGYRLYVDFFSQHMPVPYYAVALVTELGITDLISYRVVFAIAVTVVLGLAMLHFRHRLSTVLLSAVAISIGFGHPIFWGYMVLADHFFAMALLVLVLFALSGQYELSLPRQIVVSACCFVAVQSTLISVYPLVWIATWYVMYRLRAGRWRVLALVHELPFAAIVLAPHVLLSLILWQHGTLSALIDQAFVFNQVYYSRYDIGGDPASILLSSLREFALLFVRYFRPSAWRDVEAVLLVSNLAAVAVLFRTRGRAFAAWYVGLVLLSRMRGPGYHGSPYFVVSFVSLAVVLAFAAQTLGGRALRLARGLFDGSPAAVALEVALAGFVFFVGTFFHDIAGFDLRLPRGTGLESPYVRIVSAATVPGDRIWVAPFEPSVYLQSDRLPASSIAYFHPWLADSPVITAQLLHDLETNRPPAIVFESDKRIDWLFPLPVPAEFAAQVFAYITSDYVAADPHDQVLKNVYLRGDEVDTLRQRLTNAGILTSGLSAVSAASAMAGP